MINAIRRFGLLVGTGAILASPPLHAAGEHHWSYSGDTGPAQWAALESDYSACGVGKLQSPIDIRASAVKMVHEGPACIMRRCRHGKPVHHAHQDSRVMLPDITVWPNRQSWQLPGHDPARLLGMGNRDRLTPAARSWPDA